MVRHRSISHHKHHRQVEIKDGNELHPYVEQKGQEAHDAHFHADPSEQKAVRFRIIRNARIENLGEYQSCMVSKLPMCRDPA